MKITDCQPDSGNPTVRDERGAYGNVSYGGTRNPLHTPKGCRTETLCLRLRAPYFYPTSGACLHRGNSGTWESHLSPCRHARIGGPGDQRPWRVPGASTRTRARKGHHKRLEARKVSGRERQVKRPERGRVAVVASYSTEERGEVRPKRPTGGKATSGRAGSGPTHERDFGLTNRVTRPPLHCRRGSRSSA